MSNALHVPFDAATARIADGTRSPAYPRLVIATTIMASSLAFIDGSVVNVGLPAIGRSFHAEAIGLQWVVNAYLLPLSALLLLGGAAGDRYGRRRLLIAGVLLFGIASLACAAAPTLTLLLLARFVQGASAAMLMPNSLAILGQSFSGEAKGRAIGIWAATGAAAGAIGPVAPVSPWQNGFAERLIGSIRRECLDHIIVLGEASAPNSAILCDYYNGVRTHRSLMRRSLVKFNGPEAAAVLTIPARPRRRRRRVRHEQIAIFDLYQGDQKDNHGRR